MNKRRAFIIIVSVSVLFTSFVFGGSNFAVAASKPIANVQDEVQNQPPVAEPLAIATSMDQRVPFTLTGSDPDGDPLLFNITSFPSQGILDGFVPNLVYIPNDGYVGEDSFTFVVFDGYVESEPATVSIWVTNAPIADPQTVTTVHDQRVPFTLTGSDPDGEALLFNITSFPSQGILDGFVPNLVYIPNDGYVGEDSFTFVVFDGYVESEPATVTIQVINNAPVADPLMVTTSVGERVPFTLTGSDPDGDPLLFNITSFPSQGILDGFVPNLVYIPNDGYVGEDSFTFVVFDGYEESEPATVSIWVTNAPIADPQTVTTVHDQRVPFTLTGSDPDGEALLFNITSFPSQGILDGFVPNLVYIPNDGYVGEDSFTFVVFDGYVESEPATVTIQVINNAPVADPLMVTTSVGERVPFTLTGSDPDGDPLLFNITSFPSQGILDGFVPNLVYIPNDGYVGEDSFTFVVFDGYVESEPATVTIQVINNAPVADPLMVTTSVGERVPFTLTGSDPDGDPLLFNITSFPSQGILDGFVPNLVYIPNDGYVGEDSFTFVVFDGYEESLPATVSINITPSGPITVFEDDFESSTGWVRNPYGTDTARRGLWEIANPESVWYFGYKQLGTTVSGDKDLVTGARAGWLPGDNDVDYGTTSMRSPLISLPADKSISLSLSYYLAHASNSSSSDYLRIIVIGQETNTIFEVLGRNRDVDATWTGLAIDLSGFAGQQIYILIEVADLGYQSLVEAAVDDILIVAQ